MSDCHKLLKITPFVGNSTFFSQAIFHHNSKIVSLV